MTKEDIKKYLTWKWGAIAALCIIFLAVLLIRIFSPDDEAAASGAGPSGPQEVLSGFYSALVSGKIINHRTFIWIQKIILCEIIWVDIC